MLVIGSEALTKVKGFEKRDVRDTDFIATLDEIKKFRDRHHIRWSYPNATGTKIIACWGSRPVEFDIEWEGSTNAEFREIVMKGPFQMGAHWGADTWVYPPLPALYALKMTHRFVSGKHFLKTMNDIRMMRDRGIKEIPPEYQDWFKRREKETLQRKHPKLNKSREDFFNPAEGVNYVYDHDSIHRVMAYDPETPAYTKFQRPGSEVWCDKRLFDKSSLDVRLHSVAEEAYVLAIERAHVPHGKMTAKAAFDLALEKVCTTISSGWWREFAWEHYFDVQRIYRPDYVERFWSAVAQGEIPPFQGKMNGRANLRPRR